MSRIGKLFLLASTSLTIAIGGCLPDNFWGDKLAEVVNGLILNGLDSIIEPAIGFGIS